MKPVDIGACSSIRNRAVALQIGTMALVPQIADAVSVPVIAAGGIAAAFALGASGVQIGTGFLLCPEAATPALHRDAVRHAHEHETVVTNVFSGRPARALVNVAQSARSWRSHEIARCGIRKQASPFEHFSKPISSGFGLLQQNSPHWPLPAQWPLTPGRVMCWGSQETLLSSLSDLA